MHTIDNFKHIPKVLTKKKIQIETLTVENRIKEASFSVYECHDNKITQASLKNAHICFPSSVVYPIWLQFCIFAVLYSFPFIHMDCFLSFVPFTVMLWNCNCNCNCIFDRISLVLSMAFVVLVPFNAKTFSRYIKFSNCE